MFIIEWEKKIECDKKKTFCRNQNPNGNDLNTWRNTSYVEE